MTETFKFMHYETNPETGATLEVWTGSEGTVKKRLARKKCNGACHRAATEQKSASAFSAGQDTPQIRDLRQRLEKYKLKRVDPVSGAVISVPAAEQGEYERRCRMQAYANREGLDINTYEGLRAATVAVDADRDKVGPDLYEQLIQRYCEKHSLNPRDDYDRATAIKTLRPALDHIVQSGL